MLSRLAAVVALAAAFVVAPVVLAPASAVTPTTENAGSVTYVFDLGAVPLTGSYSTFDGDAVAGSDYTTTTGTFTAQTGNLPVTVPLVNDTTNEPVESFFITFSWGGGGSFSELITITDDDPIPSISINDVSAFEGSADTTATFTVSLSNPSTSAVTVQYATAAGTALTPSDFTATTGTLTFAPGVTTQTVAVTVIGDNVYELDETYAVNLSTPVAATISDAQGIGTIRNDEDTPSINMSPEFPVVTEGDTGTTTLLTFSVGTLAPTDVPITFDIVPVDVTATRAADYEVPTTSFTIPAGAGSITFDAQILGDDVAEGTERFRLELANVTNAAIGEQALAIIQITDDDPTPTALGVTGSSPVLGLTIGSLTLLAGAALVLLDLRRRRLLAS